MKVKDKTIVSKFLESSGFQKIKQLIDQQKTKSDKDEDGNNIEGEAERFVLASYKKIEETISDLAKKYRSLSGLIYKEGEKQKVFIRDIEHIKCYASLAFDKAFPRLVEETKELPDKKQWDELTANNTKKFFEKDILKVILNEELNKLIVRHGEKLNEIYGFAFVDKEMMLASFLEVTSFFDYAYSRRYAHKSHVYDMDELGIAGSVWNLLDEALVHFANHPNNNPVTPVNRVEKTKSKSFDKLKEHLKTILGEEERALNRDRQHIKVLSFEELHSPDENDDGDNYVDFETYLLRACEDGDPEAGLKLAITRLKAFISEILYLTPEEKNTASDFLDNYFDFTLDAVDEKDALSKFMAAETGWSLNKVVQISEVIYDEMQKNIPNSCKDHFGSECANAMLQRFADLINGEQPYGVTIAEIEQFIAAQRRYVFFINMTGWSAEYLRRIESSMQQLNISCINATENAKKHIEITLSQLSIDAKTRIATALSQHTTTKSHSKPKLSDEEIEEKILDVRRYLEIDYVMRFNKRDILNDIEYETKKKTTKQKKAYDFEDGFEPFLILKKGWVDEDIGRAKKIIGKVLEPSLSPPVENKGSSAQDPSKCIKNAKRDAFDWVRSLVRSHPNDNPKASDVLRADEILAETDPEAPGGEALEMVCDYLYGEIKSDEIQVISADMKAIVNGATHLNKIAINQQMALYDLKQRVDDFAGAAINQINQGKKTDAVKTERELLLQIWFAISDHAFATDSGIQKLGIAEQDAQKWYATHVTIHDLKPNKHTPRQSLEMACEQLRKLLPDEAFDEFYPLAKAILKKSNFICSKKYSVKSTLDEIMEIYLREKGVVEYPLIKKIWASLSASYYHATLSGRTD